MVNLPEVKGAAATWVQRRQQLSPPRKDGPHGEETEAMGAETLSAL